MRQLEDLLNEAREILREAGVAADSFVVIGALAAIEHRHESRTTKDVDLLLDQHVDLSEAFQRHGFTVRTVRDPSEPLPHMYQMRRGVDIVDVIFADTEFQQSAITRAKDGYISPEDVIMHKLIAWRPRDRDDVLSILAADHELNRAYIEHWATEWDVTDRWQEALTEFEQNSQ